MYLRVMYIYQMILRIFIVSFLLSPLALFSQTRTEILQTNQTKEIYSLVQFLIKKEKLKRSYGLKLSPASDLKDNRNDSIYLQSLLIKPKKVDTTIKIESNDFVIVSDVTWPDKNILTKADINYILATKKLFKDFKWDNKLLGFNINNTDYYYSISIPYFNMAHNKAIVTYEFLCPGLCGSGKTVVLRKTKTDWEITSLDIWFH